MVAIKRFVKIFTPLSCSPRGVFENLRVTFKLLLLESDRTSVREVFSFQVQLMFQIFELGLFYNEVLVLLDTEI